MNILKIKEITRVELKNKLQNYLDEFGKFCSENSVYVNGIDIDHICYKCSSKEEYEIIRCFFEYDDIFIYQSIFSKRRISIIRFLDPLKSICGDVHCLELSDQKPDGSQGSKVDHIEPVPKTISYEEMLGRFSKLELPIEENIKPHHSTHYIVLPNGIKLKFNNEPLIPKIYRDEMVIKNNL